MALLSLFLLFAA